jgi:hypothetical protein
MKNRDNQLAASNWHERQQQQSLFFYGYKSQAARRGGKVGPRLAIVGR